MSDKKTSNKQRDSKTTQLENCNYMQAILFCPQSDKKQVGTFSKVLLKSRY